MRYHNVVFPGDVQSYVLCSRQSLDDRFFLERHFPGDVLCPLLQGTLFLAWCQTDLEAYHVWSDIDIVGIDVSDVDLELVENPFQGFYQVSVFFGIAEPVSRFSIDVCLFVVADGVFLFPTGFLSVDFRLAFVDFVRFLFCDSFLFGILFRPLVFPVLDAADNQSLD